ncbi:MAG TPA: SdpI family protein [Dermatophilaceae bacterium]|nr:SdpI family protein [Dermatophilaceae bacterium]
MIPAGSVCALVGVVHLVLGVASRTERLLRNYFAGIKTTRMLQSDDAWRVGHRAAAPLFLAIGGIGIVFSVVIAVLSGSDDAATTYLLSYMALVVVGLAAATWLAHRAVR